MLSLVSAATVEASNFADTYGYSATGIAMGNSITAVVSDWSSVFYNIAGLGRTKSDKEKSYSADITHKSTVLTLNDKTSKKESSAEKHSVQGQNSEDLVNQVSLSMLYTQPRFAININREGVKGDENLQFGMFIIGLAIDINKVYALPKFISSARFGLGLSSLSDGYASRINDIDLKTHNFLRYGREAQKAVIIAGVGFGFLNDAFGIGFGANMNFKGEGKVLVSDVQVGPSEQTPESQSRTDLKAAPAAVAGIYVSPGKFTRLLEGLEIGACYRQESYMELYPFQTSTTMLVGGMEMSMNMSIFENYTPHIVVFGLGYTRGNWTLTLAVEYQMWSKYKFSRTIEIVYADAVSRLGEDYKLPKFNDIIIPRGGISYNISSWISIMGGYYYQPSFIPDSEMKGRLNLLDNSLHAVALGLKISVPRLGGMGGPLTIILSGQYQYLVEREVIKRNPDPTWNPNYTYGGQCISAIMEVSMRL